MAAVLDPLRIGGTTEVRNRLYRAPVLEGAGDDDDCAERYAKAFVPNATAGVGLIVQGNSCFAEEGRTSPGMTRVHTRERMLRLAPMVDPSPSVMESPRAITADVLVGAGACTPLRKNQDSIWFGNCDPATSWLWFPGAEM